MERRIEKTINGKTIQYLYDGLDIVQEIKDGMVTVNYIRTLNIDEPLARIEADGTIRYYHADALGSIIALTDDLGNVRTQYNYSPFGETEIIGEPSDNPFQYTARENDNTGLYYFRARYYSPYLKRFISEDPIGLFGGDVNLYGYVWNSPLRWIDPWGLWGSEYGLVELAKYGHTSSEFMRERQINKETWRTIGVMTGTIAVVGTAAYLGPEIYWFAMVHPELANKLFDFLTGFVPYPPSPTPASYWGFGTSWVIQQINEIINSWDESKLKEKCKE